MNRIGKYIPFIMLILAMAITACSSENNDANNELINKKLSLNTFETLKGQLLDINDLNKRALKTGSYSRLEQNNHILSQVNEFYGTQIDFDDSLKELDSAEEIFNWLKINSTFDQNDIDILTNFSSDLTSVGFDEAVSILGNKISNESIDLYKFEKYQSIINGVALIEYQYPGYFTVENKNTQAKGGWGCAFAVGKLALASAALVGACSPPAMGASMGWTCYVAATAFIAASASVGMAC